MKIGLHAMITRDKILSDLVSMPDRPEVLLVQKQYVPDIIHYMPIELKKCRGQYSVIAGNFDADTVDEICQNIFDFLKYELDYFEESEQMQQLSSPKTMLERGYCDCKGYALFSAGILDALGGMSWCFRFVPSAPLGTKIGHVFVVVDPGTSSELWIDPVLGRFNARPIYLVKKDIYVGVSEKISGLTLDERGSVIGLTGPEQSLLDQLNEYTLGVQDAVSVSINTGTINTITKGIVQTAASIIPGVGVALAILNAATTLLNNAFGSGSLAARLISDISSNLLLAPYAIVKTLLNPGARTFESDQYFGATYYYYYVQGKANYLNSPARVADADVIPALKWFIDRLGVFISGREHIQALVQGASQYMALHSVNSYTTIDPNKVNAAVLVAQQYFNFNGNAGSWANTVGVFDVQLVEIANELGQSVEQVNAQVASGQLVVPGVTAEGESNTLMSWIKNLYSDPVAWIVTGAAVIGLTLIIVSDE